jgi:Mg2+ and Co2+ transporter CorA
MSLEWALDEISQDSLDDFLMSRRLEDWRALMSQFEINVPAIGKSLHEFVSFVFRDDAGTALPEAVQRILEDVDANIARIKDRLDEAYTALRADMQFSESRRSIAEAKTVTKLTELAFIFIPLSFTASLFSMSIHQLEEPAPLWTFIVTSIGMALLAYLVRVVLTSEFIAESSRGALERF